MVIKIQLWWMYMRSMHNRRNIYAIKIQIWWLCITSARLLKKNESAVKIQLWWKKTTSTKSMRRVWNYIVENLTECDLQEISDKCWAISKICKKDGAGLTGGTLIDMFLCEYFHSKFDKFIDFHENDSDMKLCNSPLSLKKITGKSTIALNWSKNKNADINPYFRSNILIINLKSQRWWIKSPMTNNICSLIKIEYNDIIPSGFYIIDKNFCKKHIILKSNNKTNSLIESQYLYIMLKRSIQLKTFICIPEPNESSNFNILKAFS